MMKDRLIKALKVLIFIVYCVCGFLSVYTFIIFRLADSPSLEFGIIPWEHPLVKFALSNLVPMGIAMPIATTLFRIAYRRKFRKKIVRKLLVYIPWILIWAEFVIPIVYVAVTG